MHCPQPRIGSEDCDHPSALKRPALLLRGRRPEPVPQSASIRGCVGHDRARSSSLVHDGKPRGLSLRPLEAAWAPPVAGGAPAPRKTVGRRSTQTRCRADTCSPTFPRPWRAGDTGGPRARHVHRNANRENRYNCSDAPSYEIALFTGTGGVVNPARRLNTILSLES